MPEKTMLCKGRCPFMAIVIESMASTGGSMLTYQFSDDILCTGQPVENDLKTFKNEGYRSIVNLRPESEPGQIPHAHVVAQELGLEYHAFPVAGPGELNATQAQNFDALLQNVARPPVIHCGSSNRVGALMALRAAYVENKDKSAALEEGRKAGLTALEPLVQQILGV